MKALAAPTVRLKLTLLYGGLFAAAGAVLLMLNYGLVRHKLVETEPLLMQAELPGPEMEVAPGIIVQRRVLEYPLTEDGKPVADVLEGVDQAVRQSTLQQLVTQSLVALVFMTLLSLILGWIVAGRVLRPLHAITGAAKRLSQENLHERLNLSGPRDELKELADTFDAMLARLEEAFESQRRFVANASHELRTPLSIMRTEIDVTLANPDSGPDDMKRMALTIRDAVDRTDRLIDGLLVLARSERGPESVEVVDLGELAADALRQLAAQAQALELDVDQVVRSAPVTGNRLLLERMVYNLVDNAIAYNVAGGRLQVETASRGDQALLLIRNSGDIIDPEQVPGLFEPFRRRGSDRVGSHRGLGLGLSIVKAVVGSLGRRDHGGASTGGRPGSDRPASRRPGHTAGGRSERRSSIPVESCDHRHGIHQSINMRGGRGLAQFAERKFRALRQRIRIFAARPP